MSHHQKMKFHPLRQGLTTLALIILFAGLSRLILVPPVADQTAPETASAGSQQPPQSQADLLRPSLQSTQTYTSYLPLVTKVDPAAQLVELINAERVQRGCPPLTVSPLLQTAAENHSQDMALNDFYDFDGSDGSTLLEQLAAVGYNAQGGGMRIAAGDHRNTPESALQGCTNNGVDTFLVECGDEWWQQSEDIGAGYYYLPNDTGEVNRYHYWTVFVGQPQ